MALLIKPPYPPTEALSVENIPSVRSWRYEPKWDGFRCLAFISREIASDTALNFYVGALTSRRRRAQWTKSNPQAELSRHEF